jgi:hypothetical protein
MRRDAEERSDCCGEPKCFLSQGYRDDRNNNESEGPNPEADAGQERMIGTGKEQSQKASGWDTDECQPLSYLRLAESVAGP